MDKATNKIDEYTNEIMTSYQKEIEEEDRRQNENTTKVLEYINKVVSENYFTAITAFLKDKENGIWGDLKLVESPIGEWQDEYQDEEDDTNYWNILKGMYVYQRCGYSGDDYSGYLEVKVTNSLLLRCSFSL